MKQLRLSQFNDYVAVDDVDDKGKILSTPIYLQKDKPSFLLSYDEEERKYLKTTVVFDGKQLICSADFKWESPVDELVEKSDSGMPLFKPYSK